MKKLVIFAGLILTLTGAASAQVATGGNYRLEQSVVASGGGSSTGGTGGIYKVESTIGEPIAGTTSSSPSYSLKGGFLSVGTLAPTAAPVSIDGRVLTNGGSGLVNALVTLTDASGASRTVLTRKSGAFRFDDLNAGETYIISVRSKRYTFQPQVLSILENTFEVVFVAQ